MVEWQNKLKKEHTDNSQELTVPYCVYSDHSFNSRTITEVKNSNISPPSGPVALVTTASSKAITQPADGDVAMKTEVDQKTEGEGEGGGG